MNKHNSTASWSLLVLLSAGAVLATPTWAQSTKLLPGDGKAGEAFGRAVSVSGAVAVVGAPNDVHPGSGRGSAYLFDAGTGTQLAKLLAQDFGAAVPFGWSVGISGNVVVVGSPEGFGVAQGSGAAYLFDAATGLQTAKLVGDDDLGLPEFGWAVAVSEFVAIIGAPGEGLFTPISGRAYLFDTTSGTRLAKLSGEADGRFGHSVAIHGSRAVVGEPEFGPGAAYYFSSAGTQLAKLLANDGALGDRFGDAVGISSLAIAVGAPLDDDQGLESGSVYLFDPSTGLQTAKLLASDGLPGDRFGAFVAVSGTTVAVGAGGNGSGAGCVYVFDTISGAQLHKFAPSDGSTGDAFGTSVALSGNTLITGAPGGDDLGPNSGAAYITDLSNPPDNSGSGFCAGDGEGTNCPCGGNGNPGEGCANTGGVGGASLRGVGHASLTSDTFQLEIQGVPGAKPGLIFRGSNQHASGFGAQVGDGLLCTSSQTARSHVQITAGGTTSFANTNGSPFSTWTFGAGAQTNYQFWYRDPSNTCTGLGFNWTNAWTVTWLP